MFFRYDLTPIYMYGNYEWGSLDPDTGISIQDSYQLSCALFSFKNLGLWSGVVGMVGYGESDIGVSIISYTQERNVLSTFHQDS